MTLALLADLAQVLAEAFLEPEAALQARLEDLLAGAPVPALAGPLRRMVTHGLAPADQPVEYARLFLHAKDTDTVHLFESVQARGHHMAPQVLGPLKAIYDEADISLQEGLGVPPDHLGLEFACLSYLLGQASEGDGADRPRFMALSQRLLQEHLRPFTATVAGQLPQVSAHLYYQATADLAAALLLEVEKQLVAAGLPA